MGCALQQTLKSDNPFDMKQRRAKDFIEAPNSWPLLLLALNRLAATSDMSPLLGAKLT
jgi:hypothetical protein